MDVKILIIILSSRSS